jgi:hypothetical protein
LTVAAIVTEERQASEKLYSNEVLVGKRVNITRPSHYHQITALKPPFKFCGTRETPPEDVQIEGKTLERIGTKDLRTKKRQYR